MDRERVIKGIQECDLNGGLIGNCPYKDILSLLKEQEAVEPITEHHLFLCPVCKSTLFREQKFCHECGKRIEWKGW